jgi:phenylacetate-coenzyme A ligase PaaK-like adenylate-forming protein
VGTHVPFYKKKFEQLKLNFEDIRSLDGLRRLPFTVKQDLRDNYPYGLFAVPLRDVVRVHSSSGTTGLATVVGYSKNDIKNWSNLQKDYNIKVHKLNQKELSKLKKSYSDAMFISNLKKRGIDEVNRKMYSSLFEDFK